MTTVPLNDHRRAAGPDTSLDEHTATDDEFRDRASEGLGRANAPAASRPQCVTPSPYPGHRTDTRRKARRS